MSLWLGLLAGPTVWLMLLEFNYVGAYVACETRSTWFLHTATAVAVILVTAAGFFAWRARHAGTLEVTDEAAKKADRKLQQWQESQKQRLSEELSSSPAVPAT